jgi:hypothetical protein
MLVHVRRAELIAAANAYENELFGSDFYTEVNAIEAWLKSPLFFWSVCTNNQITDKYQIIGSLSILVTSEHSIKQLLASEIKESELEPWVMDNRSEPALYFSSYVAEKPGAGRLQFAAAKVYLKEIYSKFGIKPMHSFSIAANRHGAKHLMESGFKESTGNLYMQKYSIYEARCEYNLRKLWSDLLNC